MILYWNGELIVTNHNGNTKQGSRLKNQKDEDEEPNEELWEDQSFEEYYSTHESEETSQPSDLEDEENENYEKNSKLPWGKNYPVVVSGEGVVS